MNCKNCIHNEPNGCPVMKKVYKRFGFSKSLMNRELDRIDKNDICDDKKTSETEGL